VGAVLFFLQLQLMAAAGPPSLDDFGDVLAQHIKDAKIHSLAVSGFVVREDTISPRGQYLAARLCESWHQRHRDLVIVKPVIFDDTLKAQKLSPRDLKIPERLNQIGKTFGVDAVMLGSLADTTAGYLLTVMVRAVSDGSLVFTTEQSIAHSRVFDSLAATDADTAASAPRAGTKGAGIPACAHAPMPVFPGEARKAEISSASVILTVVITQEGRATEIRVTRDPGFGFAERAIETLTEWRCKPALDKDKKPMAVTVPIEMTFRN
jgi:TonB family protein